MAEVYHARLQRIGGFERDVAVKVLLPEYSSESEFVEMLLDEARIAGAINHPNVVQVLDVGQKNELFYLVMEHVDGGDLRSFLKKSPHRTLPLPATLYIVSEVLRGLGAVHTAVDQSGVPRRIVHRDVSPANVMISRAGIVKLGDFGIAHASSRLTRTRKGAVKGKLRYMAPEQIASGRVDHRADLYAVGIMLCEILLGDSACEPKKMTQWGPVFAWTPRLATWLPPDVAQIAERALAEDPQRRFPDALQFRQKVLAALHKRAPGYSSEELARDLASLEDGFLSEQPTIASEPIELSHEDAGMVTEPQPLFSEHELDNKVTQPAIRAPVGERVAAVAQPFVPMPRVSQSRSSRVNLKKPLWTRSMAAWAAGAAGAAALAVAALLITGASSAARPPTADEIPPMVIEKPLPTATRISTGTLAVDGPPGASVMIGSTVYPAGNLELPPGEYQVKLRKRAHGRSIIRRVTIAAGAVTPIKI
jgi:serine/threonine-protein kinase